MNFGKNVLHYQALIEEVERHRLEVRPERPLSVIAVSKTVPAHRIRPLLEAGHRDFGENRIQEATTKWPELKQQYPNVRLHLLGYLQRNKLASMLGLADYFHSLDRKQLVEDLLRRRDAGSRIPQLFLQVNIDNEPQKSGCQINEVPALVTLCRDHDLPLIGLMAIPPLDKPATPFFAMCSSLAKDNGLTELSLGMSNDWQSAVMLGSSWLRLGTVLFGNRAVVS